jgi:ABC-2 type transport system permease protein
MRRALIIAGREYLSFLRTPGFWVSLLLMPLIGLFSGLAPQMIARSEPPPTVAILDLSGLGADGPGAWLATSLQRPPQTAPEGRVPAEAPPRGEPHQAIALVPLPPELAGHRSPEAAGQAIRAYLAKATPLQNGRPLSAAVVIWGDREHLRMDLWTPSAQTTGWSSGLEAPLNDWLRRARLAAAGVPASVADTLDHRLTEIRNFSPRAARGRVSLADKAPMLVAVGLSFLLWALVLTGAGILLNTVVEEKSNRVIEVLLSSASVTEILSGKILGGAALSLTTLSVWSAIGFWLLRRSSPDVLGVIGAALTGHGLVLWFAAFFIVGYLMYASIFAAIGSYCETPREAQTLLGPVMVVLTVPIIFLGATLSAPDAPVLKVLVWVPLFTPFLMTTRVAAGAPPLELVVALGEMVITAGIVIWLSGRAFRSGALATEKIDLRRLLRSLVGNEA